MPDDSSSDDDFWEVAGFVRTPEEVEWDGVEVDVLCRELLALADLGPGGSRSTGSWTGESVFYDAIRTDWTAALASDTFSSDDIERAYNAAPCATLLIAFSSCTKSYWTKHRCNPSQSFEYVGASQRLGVEHAIFVRDPLQAWFLRSDGYNPIVALLSQEVQKLAPQRIVTVGSSMGGYAAIRAAVALGARHPSVKSAALAFGPQVFLDPLEREALQLPLQNFDPELAALKRASVPLESLIDVSRAAGDVGMPHVEIHCGSLARGDVHEAQLLQQSQKKVQVVVHKRHGHSVAMQLHSAKELDPIIRGWLSRCGASTTAAADHGGLDIDSWLSKFVASRRLPDRRRLVGPLPPPTARCCDSTDDLLGHLYAAQCVCTSSLPEWINDKVERKKHWATRGVEAHLLVPTLISCRLEWDGETRLPVPEVLWDEAGEVYTPNMEAGAPIQWPSDPTARAMLLAQLGRHRTVVLKPARGSNSRGVLLLSLYPAATIVPDASGRLQTPADDATRARERAADLGGPTITDETAVWLGGPNKVIGAELTERCVPFATLWQEAVLQNVELAGPSRVFLAEPAIAHDQELCVLAVDGGRLQLAAGRSLVMERLLMLDDEPEW